MNKKSKKQKYSVGIKKIIMNKYISYKSYLKVKIGEQALSIIKKINVFFVIVGYISSVVTIYGFFAKSDNSIAIDNYQKGIIYFEDGYLEEAQQCFKKAYEINNNLLDIKFYYAYTEYLLKNYDKSFKILEENRNTLNADEIAFYATYEYSKDNYKKSSEYLNKIRQPENLKVESFVLYIATSTELGFRNNYSEGISTLYANITLLDAKINEAQQLPSVEKMFHVEADDTELREIEAAKEVARRIDENTLDEVLMLKRCMLCTYMQFITHSIQYDEYILPIFIFDDAADLVDFVTNYDMSIKYIEALFIFSIGAQIEPEQPEEIEKSYQIIDKKYKELNLLEEQMGINILEEEDRENLEACEAILIDLENDSLSSDWYHFNFSEFDEKEENYEFGDIVKLWADAFLEKLYIRNIL